MPAGLANTHLDNFLLLRFVAGDVDDLERARVQRHVKGCPACVTSLEEVRLLDTVLREERETIFKPPAKEGELAQDDPFVARAEAPDRPPSSLGFGDVAFTRECAAARKAADALRDALLRAARAAAGDDIRRLLADLDLSDLPHRYALGHALDEAYHRMVEGPACWLALAQVALARLRREPIHPFREIPDDEVTPAEFAYPFAELVARAHLLSGAARNWTGEYDRAGEDLREAYRLAGMGKAQGFLFALIEVLESQRRAFLGEPDVARGALVLADRAAGTFASLGLTEHLARATGARGLALSALGREEEALAAFRATLPLYAEHEHWNGYATALNNIGSSLQELGRVDEARREYARALRRVSRTEQPSVHAFIRYGLAMLLFTAGRYEQAIRALAPAARLFEEQGATADALIATLTLIESHARAGHRETARLLLEDFRTLAERHGALDPSTLREIERAFSDDEPDFERLAELRPGAEDEIRERMLRAG